MSVDCRSYLKYRKANLKAMFKTSETFKYKPLTTHFAVSLYDKIMNLYPCVNMVEWLRERIESCNGVISE